MKDVFFTTAFTDDLSKFINTKRQVPEVAVAGPFSDAQLKDIEQFKKQFQIGHSTNNLTKQALGTIKMFNNASNMSNMSKAETEGSKWAAKELQRIQEQEADTQFKEKLRHVQESSKQYYTKAEEIIQKEIAKVKAAEEAFHASIEETLDKNPAIKFDTGKRDWSLVPFEAFETMVDVLEFGKKKYSAWNWASDGGFSHTRLLNSLMRHMFAYSSGEDTDPESGLSHLGHAQCCLMFLTYYKKYPEKFPKDDRNTIQPTTANKVDWSGEPTKDNYIVKL